MPVHLTAEQRQLALRLKARAYRYVRSGPRWAAHTRGGADRTARPRRLVRQDRWVPGPGRLTLADREEITLGVPAGESFTMIAARLGKATSTVSREVAANGGRAQYRAWRAHQRARQQARRPKTSKLAMPRWPPGQQLAGPMVVAGADLGPVADPVPRRSHDVGEPRDDRPGPGRAGPRRAAPRAAPAACAPGEPSAARVAAVSTPASSGTW
jgi:hypothetical protein